MGGSSGTGCCGGSLGTGCFGVLQALCVLGVLSITEWLGGFETTGCLWDASGTECIGVSVGAACFWRFFRHKVILEALQALSVSGFCRILGTFEPFQTLGVLGVLLAVHILGASPGIERFGISPATWDLSRHQQHRGTPGHPALKPSPSRQPWGSHRHQEPAPGSAAHRGQGRLRTPWAHPGPGCGVLGQQQQQH